MKRIIFAFLAVVVICSIAHAKYYGGSGEPNNPYQIANVADLLTLANDTNDYNKCFILINDINLDPCLPGGQVFTTAVIESEIGFSGTFDGAGHKIINLTINTNGLGNDFLGLFGRIRPNSVVKNLFIEDITIAGGDNSFCIGGLVGYNSNGTISNISVTGSVSGGDNTDSVGGLVGIGDIGSVSNSAFTGDVVGGNHSRYVGGLEGINDGGSITNCFSSGTVTSGDTSHLIGGLTGSNYGIINNSFSTTVISTGPDSYLVGGFVGQNAGGTISGSYFLDVAGPNNGYGTPLTDSQMKQQSSFVGWDFVWETVNGPNDIWVICEGVSYPKLAWQFIAGDSDNNKDVDFADFALMGRKWRQADSTLYCGGTDLTGDEFIDLDDLAVLTGNWLAGL